MAREHDTEDSVDGRPRTAMDRAWNRGISVRRSGGQTVR